MSDRLRASAVRGLVVLVPVLAMLVVTGCGDGGEEAGAGASVEVMDVGFMTPESVLMDTVADVYLVSNINGGPTDEDDNGFISRVLPDGTVENLRWIDGAAGLFPLNAPKGMAISGDTLFVTDITCVRMFNRTTGEFLSDLCLDGTTFLNDVALGPEGSIFVTDTGVRMGASGLEPAGTDAVYRIPRLEGRQGATLAKAADLGGPNGIALSSRGIFVVTFGSGEVLRFTAEGDKTVLLPASNRQYDGIVFANDGSFLFTAWGDSSVYMVDAAGGVHRAITGLESPADLGYDPKRNRIMIPLFNRNAVVFYELGQPEAATGT